MNQHQYTQAECLQLLSRYDGAVQEVLIRYAADEGQWITIGGKEEGGKKHVGGFPVLVKDGKIVAGGPKELRGKKVEEAGGVLREKRLGRHDFPEKPLTPAVPSGTNREEKEAGGTGNAPAGGTPDKGGIPMSESSTFVEPINEGDPNKVGTLAHARKMLAAAPESEKSLWAQVVEKKKARIAKEGGDGSGRLVKQAELDRLHNR